jgi:hypothetical protein
MFLFLVAKMMVSEVLLFVWFNIVRNHVIFFLSLGFRSVHITKVIDQAIF